MFVSHVEIDNVALRRSDASPHADVTCDAVDMAMLISLEVVQVEGEPDLIVELIDLYLEDAPRQMAVMQKAIAVADGVSLKRAAHSLKGSSANLGARRLAGLCEELEQMCRAESFQEVMAQLARLEQELERVRQSFAAERQRRS
jgi:two-component system, sensor histidine kinase and response regulator